jgi:hypothetical protein
MRYAALVTSAESTQFGSYRVISSETKRTGVRLPDEALFALALYIYSLQPPPNPNPFDDKARAGQAIFRREGCPNCHSPPLYTNNRITLASGFQVPTDKPLTLDVLNTSVRTDPGLATKTRKGTGYYKVPSLKGLWYRGHYLHDGSAASLEEMFDRFTMTVSNFQFRTATAAHVLILACLHVTTFVEKHGGAGSHPRRSRTAMGRGLQNSFEATVRFHVRQFQN